MKPLQSKILISLFVLCFCLMLGTQAALTNAGARDLLAVNNSLEGKPLGLEEFLYKEGTITLECTDTDRYGSLNVLVNGNGIGSFQDKLMEITVKDGDVIEIKGNDPNHSSLVYVKARSTNICDDCLEKSAVVSSGLQKLVRIKMK